MDRDERDALASQLCVDYPSLSAARVGDQIDDALEKINLAGVPDPIEAVERLARLYLDEADGRHQADRQVPEVPSPTFHIRRLPSGQWLATMLNADGPGSTTRPITGWADVAASRELFGATETWRDAIVENEFMADFGPPPHRSA